MLTKLLGIVTLINSIISGVKFVYTLVSDFLTKRRIKKDQADTSKKTEDLNKANEVTDDEARLKAKADALCKLEKKMDPSSDCDSGV